MLSFAQCGLERLSREVNRNPESFELDSVNMSDVDFVETDLVWCYGFTKGCLKEFQEYGKLKSISRYFLTSFCIFAASLKFSLKTIMPST